MVSSDDDPALHTRATLTLKECRPQVRLDGVTLGIRIVIAHVQVRSELPGLIFDDVNRNLNKYNKNSLFEMMMQQLLYLVDKSPSHSDAFLHVFDDSVACLQAWVVIQRCPDL